MTYARMASRITSADVRSLALAARCNASHSLSGMRMCRTGVFAMSDAGSFDGVEFRVDPSPGGGTVQARGDQFGMAGVAPLGDERGVNLRVGGFVVLDGLADCHTKSVPTLWVQAQGVGPTKLRAA